MKMPRKDFLSCFSTRLKILQLLPRQSLDDHIQNLCSTLFAQLDVHENSEEHSSVYQLPRCKLVAEGLKDMRVFLLLYQYLKEIPYLLVIIWLLTLLL